ncbi:branched-chain amino acid ABC transporter permease [Micromonospora sp. NBC_01638]|uniref:branched-chain amino acid ABC transporter permease n=1 Tax=Micromonospora sp. NBC_01638 TaxID=2975982 RepID=UPI003867D0C5|nr:branched-chain amino acid ABC transporter permease [Micromonospora sp. NBC_01638]
MTLLQIATTGVLQGLIYALIGLGLYLIFNVMRVVNFAHGYFVLIGMYGVLSLAPRSLADYAVALIFVAAIAAAFGYVVERFLIESTLDKTGHAQLVITLSIGVALQYLFQVLYPEPYQTIRNPWPMEAINAFGITISFARLAAGAVSLVLALALSWLIYRTRLGVYMRACAESLNGAIFVGVNVRRVYRLTFALGAAAAAVAGGLLIPFQPVSPLYGLELTVKAFIVVVIGGSGALWGTVAAGILLGMAEAASSVYISGSLASSVIYTLFLLVILFRPQGLARRTVASA